MSDEKKSNIPDCMKIPERLYIFPHFRILPLSPIKAVIGRLATLNCLANAPSRSMSLRGLFATQLSLERNAKGGE